MKRNEIWKAIELELRTSKKRYPNWPDHPVAQAAIVSKEAGRLLRMSLDWKYSRSNEEVVREVQQEHMQQYAIQTAALAIRYLENLNNINDETKNQLSTGSK